MSFLIALGRKLNIQNHWLGRQVAADYTIIKTRTPKATGNHVMYDRGAWFLRVIMSSSGALLSLLSVKKQKHFSLVRVMNLSLRRRLITPASTLAILDMTKKKLIQWLFNIVISITAFVCQSACIRNPCKNNAKCQSGFTDKGYRCMCSDGYQGQACDEGNTVYTNR